MTLQKGKREPDRRFAWCHFKWWYKSLWSKQCWVKCLSLKYTKLLYQLRSQQETDGTSKLGKSSLIKGLFIKDWAGSTEFPRKESPGETHTDSTWLPHSLLSPTGPNRKPESKEACGCNSCRSASWVTGWRRVEKVESKACTVDIEGTGHPSEPKPFRPLPACLCWTYIYLHSPFFFLHPNHLPISHTLYGPLFVFDVHTVCGCLHFMCIGHLMTSP